MDRPYDDVRREIDLVAAERTKTGLVATGGTAERAAELWSREAELWRQLDVGAFDRAVCYARMYAEDQAAWYQANAQRVDEIRAAQAENDAAITAATRVLQDRRGGS